MTHPVFATTPGFGESAQNQFHMVLAVRVGDRVEISGQGGRREDGTWPSDLAEEYAVAWENVGKVLALVGATCDDIYQVTSYHVHRDEPQGLGEKVPLFVEQMKKNVTQPPLWTCIGVATLGEPEMNIEITVVAHSPEQ